MLSQEEYDNRMREIQKAKNKKTRDMILAISGFVVFVVFLLIITKINKNKEFENKSRTTHTKKQDYTEKQAYNFVINYGDNGYTIGNQIDFLVGMMNAEGDRCEVKDGQAIHLGNNVFSVSCVVVVNNSERHYYSWKADLTRRRVTPESELAQKLVYPK